MSEFERFRVDHQQPAAVIEALRERGIATFTGISDRAQLTVFASQFMTSRHHRDADADHVTGIRPNDDLAQRTAGTGFSRAAIPPHTEGSSLPNPPRLLLLACVSPAPIGGATVVVDGAALHRYLRDREPKAATILAEPDQVTFGAAAFPAATFERLADDRVAVRYRDDGLADIAPTARPAWRRLREAVLEHQIRFKLSKGQGIVVDNTRWLHGREAFEGGRLVNRIIGDLRTEIRLLGGFDLAEPKPASKIGQ